MKVKYPISGANSALFSGGPSNNPTCMMVLPSSVREHPIKLLPVAGRKMAARPNKEKKTLSTYLVPFNGILHLVH